MKKLLAIFAVAFCVAAQAAPDIKIERLPYGSGVQNLRGVENARPVGDMGVMHVPQYMPGWPTSATIWPHVVEVPCVGNVCKGYFTNPGTERGEYKFFIPVQVQAPVPVVERVAVIEPPLPPLPPQKPIVFKKKVKAKPICKP